MYQQWNHTRSFSVVLLYVLNLDEIHDACKYHLLPPKAFLKNPNTVVRNRPSALGTTDEQQTNDNVCNQADDVSRS